MSFERCKGQKLKLVVEVTFVEGGEMSRCSTEECL